MSADPDPGVDPQPRREVATDVAKDGPGAILVGYDGSDPARGALALGMGLARRDQAYLWVCFVASSPPLTGMAAQAAGSVAESIQDEYAGLCAEVSGFLTELGVRGECVRRDGDAAHAIEELAEQVRADMIVVGRSRSRTHAVVGSVAVALVKRANRPVVVVP